MRSSDTHHRGEFELLRPGGPLKRTFGSGVTRFDFDGTCDVYCVESGAVTGCSAFSELPQSFHFAPMGSGGGIPLILLTYVSGCTWETSGLVGPNGDTDPLHLFGCGDADIDDADKIDFRGRKYTLTIGATESVLSLDFDDYGNSLTWTHSGAICPLCTNVFEMDCPSTVLCHKMSAPRHICIIPSLDNVSDGCPLYPAIAAFWRFTPVGITNGPDCDPVAHGMPADQNCLKLNTTVTLEADPPGFNPCGFRILNWGGGASSPAGPCGCAGSWFMYPQNPGSDPEQWEWLLIFSSFFDFCRDENETNLYIIYKIPFNDFDPIGNNTFVLINASGVNVCGNWPNEIIVNPTF